MLAFALANAVSILRSDSGDEPDGKNRIGFPFIVWEEGGPAISTPDYFSWAALWSNVAAAVAACALAELFAIRPTKENRLGRR